VKCIIDLLRQPAIYTLDSRQLIYTRPGNLAQATELLQQLLAPLRPDPRYMFQW
jgi:hypothetical protein